MSAKVKAKAKATKKAQGYQPKDKTPEELDVIEKALANCPEFRKFKEALDASMQMDFFGKMGAMLSGTHLSTEKKASIITMLLNKLPIAEIILMDVRKSGVVSGGGGSVSVAGSEDDSVEGGDNTGISQPVSSVIIAGVDSASTSTGSVGLDSEGNQIRKHEDWGATGDDSKTEEKDKTE